jgi:hypothetical protein
MKNRQISSLLLQYFISQLFIPRPTYQIWKLERKF